MICARKYKTYKGAAEYAAHRRGCNADGFGRQYDYRVVMHEGFYRVERMEKPRDTLKNHLTS